MSTDDDIFYRLLNLKLAHKRSRRSFSDESKEETEETQSGWVVGMSTRHLFLMNPPPPKRFKTSSKEQKKKCIAEKNCEKLPGAAERQRISRAAEQLRDKKGRCSFDDSVLSVSSPRPSLRLRRTSSI